MAAPIPAPAGDWLPLAKMAPIVAKLGVAPMPPWTLMAVPLDPTKGGPQNLPLPGNEDRVKYVRSPITLIGSTFLVPCKEGILAFAGAAAP